MKDYRKSYFDQNFLLIPTPKSIEWIDSIGTTYLGKMMVFARSDGVIQQNLAQHITDTLMNYDTEIIDQYDSIPIYLQQNESFNPEAYQLLVSGNRVELVYSQYDGGVRGFQTLLQLLFPLITKDRNPFIPALKISDEPRFQWRGMHLDVSRNFFPVENIFRFLDILAFFKFNRFHWHLTDDQGWRIEIEQYPKLTEIGAWRTLPKGKRYGGFYTKDEIRRVVEYARWHGITVIPEVDLPGHTRAMIAAYPHLSCLGIALTVPYRWGIFKDVLCAGNDDTLTFVKNVLDELLQLFPSPVIHIGGDECPKMHWKECPKCQQRIKEERLRDERELQSWFTGQVVDYLAQKGRRAIGWNEIMEGGLPKNAMVMAWQNMQVGFEAALQGHDVVMCPTEYCYFDSYQGSYKTEPRAFPRKVYLEKVQKFDPMMPAEMERVLNQYMEQHYSYTSSVLQFKNFDSQKQLLTKRFEKHILGGQGCVWTEYMKDWQHVEYMIFPRIYALSEKLWGKGELSNKSS